MKHAAASSTDGDDNDESALKTLTSWLMARTGVDPSGTTVFFCFSLARFLGVEFIILKFVVITYNKSVKFWKI